jgi:hypothetical protein
VERQSSGHHIFGSKMMGVANTVVYTAAVVGIAEES